MADATSPSRITDVEPIVRLALAAYTAQLAGGDSERPFAVLPDGYTVRDMEEFLPTPMRKRGKVRLNQLASLVAYINAHKGPGTTIFARADATSIGAFLNDHIPSSDPVAGADWADHQAWYVAPLSPEWRTWTAQNKRPMAQADFAQFIEDNLPDVAAPPAADMLEISRTLQAKKKVAFASGTRLENGQTQFVYQEQIDGTAGAKGQLRVPETFALGIPVFEGGPGYRLEARLRYRISDQGALTLWYDLLRAHKVLEHAFGEVVAEVAKGTGVAVLHGVRE